MSQNPSTQVICNSFDVKNPHLVDSKREPELLMLECAGTAWSQCEDRYANDHAEERGSYFPGPKLLVNPTFTVVTTEKVSVSCLFIYLPNNTKILKNNILTQISNHSKKTHFKSSALKSFLKDAG